MPDWIDKPGPILLKNFTRSSKNDPLVQEVQLLDSNPHYAWVQHGDGRQQTISTRHLARWPRDKSVFGYKNTPSNDFDIYVDKPQHDQHIYLENHFQELDLNGDPIPDEGNLAMEGDRKAHKQASVMNDFKLLRPIKIEPQN